MFIDCMFSPSGLSKCPECKEMVSLCCREAVSSPGCLVLSCLFCLVFASESKAGVGSDVLRVSASHQKDFSLHSQSHSHELPLYVLPLVASLESRFCMLSECVSPTVSSSFTERCQTSCMYSQPIVNTKFSESDFNPCLFLDAF